MFSILRELELEPKDFIRNEIFPLNFCNYTSSIFGGACPVLNEQIDFFKKLGVTAIISLTEFSLHSEKFFNYNEYIHVSKLELNSIKTYHFPIQDGYIPDSKMFIDIITTMKRELESGTIYVHCWRGNGRTRTIIGAYLKLIENDKNFLTTLEKINLDRERKESLSEKQINFLNNISLLNFYNIDEISTLKYSTLYEMTPMKNIFSSDKSNLYYGKIQDVLQDDLFYNKFISSWQNLYDEISKLILVENPPIVIYGKKAYQHRDVGFFSNDSKGYYYSNQLMPSSPLTPLLEELLALINRKFVFPWNNRKYNGILINRYKDGTNYIGAHSDDEKSLGENGVIAISLGATRKFRIRNKQANQKYYEYYKNGYYQEFTCGKKNENIFDLPLENNSIIWMQGDFQKEFTHEIPIEKRVKEPRISLTFRCHLV